MRHLTLVLLGAMLFNSGVCSGQAPEERTAEKPLSPEDSAAFSYVPADATALLSVRPRAVLEHQLIAGFPRMTAQLQELARELRMDPRNMERVTIALWHGKGYFFPGRPFNPSGEEPEEEPPRRGELPGGQAESSEPPNIDAVFIIQFTKPFDVKDFEAKIRQEFTDETYKDIKYRATRSGAYSMPDPTTFLFTMRGDIEHVLESKIQAKPAKIVEQAQKKGLNHDLTLFVELAAFRPVLKSMTRFDGAQALGVAEFPDQLDRVIAQMDFQERMSFRLALEATNETAPKKIRAFYDLGYGLFAQQLPELSRQLKKEMGDELGIEMMKFLNDTYSAAKAEVAGKEFRVSLQTPPVPKTLVQKIAAWQKNREQEATRKNNLKQIAIAAHNYHEVFNKFPFPAGDTEAPKDRRNKLSWRVHLLPMLDEAELYRKFHLDEAWDSEHNKKLLEQMPAVFEYSPDAKAGHTQYVAPEGDGFIVDGDAERRLRDIIDGSSNTLMVVTVKADKAQPWTKPGGFELDPKKADEVLDNDPKGFLGLLCDGSVHWMDPKMGEETLKALLTIGGLERIDRSIYENR